MLSKLFKNATITDVINTITICVSALAFIAFCTTTLVNINNTNAANKNFAEIEATTTHKSNEHEADTIIKHDLLNFQNVGTAGILAILMLREVLNFLRKREESTHSFGDIEELKRQIDELHQWHNKDDSDGVKIWYIRSSLVSNIDKLTDTMSIQTQTLSKIESLLEHIIDQHKK